MFVDGDLGSLSPRHREIVLAKPYWRMRWFASLLGWRGLKMSWVRFSEEDARRDLGVPESRILVYYVTTDDDYHIQINELPDEPGLHQATMGPHRYDLSLVAVGWHRFHLFNDDTALLAEAERLKPLLDRQLFRDPMRRAAWKKSHPQFPKLR